MAKFNFQGKLLEQGRRVITGVINTINITKLEASDNPSGTLTVATDQAGRSSLQMSLSLPQGEKGEKGDTPNISVGKVETGVVGTTVSVTKTETEDGCAFNFFIPKGNPGDDGAQGPQGEKGEKGDTPTIEVDQRIEVLDAGADAWVEDINEDPYDAKWKFHLPKGDKGNKGTAAKITDITIDTLEPRANATASITTTYNDSTDTNNTTLSLGIPRGSKPNMGIGTVTVGDSPTVEIVDQTGEKDYLLNFGLQRGPQGPQGEPGDIVGINEEGEHTAITGLQTDTKDPHQLLVTRNGIPATDVTSGTFGVNRGGTGKSTHIANSILTGNGSDALKNISTSNGAFYATSSDGAAQFGTLPIAQGGTGATTAKNARTNLDVYSKSEVDALETSINQKITNEIDKIIVIDSKEPTFEQTKIWIKI